jgi:5-methylcytosine-specific restriction enzyme subunit McrC
MVLYAFNKVKSNEIKNDKSFEDDYTVSDVLIDLFINEVTQIVKKGLYRNYNEINEESLFIKGKIDVKRSFKSFTIKKNIIHDEYNSENGVNLILKYTLNNLLFSNIRDKHKKKIKVVYPFFQDVPYKEISDGLYKNLILNKANNFYDFAIKLSVFINKKVIPSDRLGKKAFIDIAEDNETMSMIYEEFLRNFYRLYTDYVVSSKIYDWYLMPLETSDMSLLPKLKTDIEIIINNETKILIDAKYYKNALSSRYELNKFNSANMYQMNTYLEHNSTFKYLRGILLYPCVGYYFDEKYLRKGQYTLEFRTIDLNQDWEKIENGLLQIINERVEMRL